MSVMWNSSLVNVHILVCINLLLHCPVLAATTLFGLRLTGGQTEVEGRLEIEYSVDQWGSICNDRWDWPATFVACNQLGLGPPLDHQFFVPTDNSIPIAYDNVVCQGNESRLVDCSHNGVRNHDCTHFEDVTIRCALPTGESDYALENVNNLQTLGIFNLIYYKNSWHTLCRFRWNPSEANVICSQLGLSQLNTRISYTTSVPAVFRSYECLAKYPVCTGTENHLKDCDWFDILFSLNPIYLDLICDTSMLTTTQSSTPQPDDSRLLSPLYVFFLVLFVIVMLLVLICKCLQKAQYGDEECWECCEHQTPREQQQPGQIQVISVRNLDDDDDVDISLPTHHPTEIQELPGDVPPSYDQYVSNPTLFRTFSEVRESELLEPISQAEDTVESPPPNYESATFGFPESAVENHSDSSVDTRL